MQNLNQIQFDAPIFKKSIHSKRLNKCNFLSFTRWNIVRTFVTSNKGSYKA